MIVELEPRPARLVVERNDAPTGGSFTWSARDLSAEARCEREIERASSWKVRLLGWLIEFNKY